MKEIVEKLVRAAGEAHNVPKTGFNQSQNYAYATVDDVKAAANRAFRAVGLAVVASELELIAHTPYSREPKQSGRAVVKVRLTVSDGAQHILLEGLGEGLDSGDKAVYKAMAGAVKYALTVGLLISTGDRDDPEASSDDGKPTAPKSPAQDSAVELESSIHKALQAIADAADSDALTALNKPLAKLRARVHAETGSYDKFEPVRLELTKRLNEGSK